MNSSLYDYAPTLIAAHRTRADEIVGHGRTNAERQGTLDGAAERMLILEATIRLTKEKAAHRRAGSGRGYRTATSRRICWSRPATSISSTGAWTISRSGSVCRGNRRILAVHYPQELNDIPAIVGRKENGSDFVDMIVDEFEEMRELSAARPLVMGLALHPYIVGQPHRLRHLKRALRHIAHTATTIWLTTPGAIAQHCSGLPVGLVP